MTQPQGIAKANVLQKLIRAGLSIVVILIALSGFLMLPADDPSLYVLHASPAIPAALDGVG